MAALARSDGGTTLFKLTRIAGQLAILAVPFAMLAVWPHEPNPYLSGKTQMFRVFTAIALGCAALPFAGSKRSVPLPVWLFGAMVACLAISDLLTPTKAALLGEIWRQNGLLGMVALFSYLLAIVFLEPSENAWKTIIGAWAVSGTILAAAGLYQLATSNVPRVYGLTGNPVFLGIALAFGAIFAMWSAYLAETPFWRGVWIGAALFQAAVIFTTGTRSAVAGLLVAGMLPLAMNGWKRVMVAAVSVTAIGVGLAARFFPASMPEGVSHRMQCWHIAVVTIAKHPWFGWGQENIRMICPPELWDRMHNVFLQTLVDGGVVSLTAYLAFIAAAFYQTLRTPGSAFVLSILSAYLVMVMFEPEPITTTLPFLTAIGWLATREVQKCALS